ncbi:MAG: alpha/beta hydrolase [Clostridiales bacterium]|nr:alpha/beta hydrolase [Clostridiales bacterium]
MGESEASIRGRVMRDVISHVTSDHLIGKKIKNGELRKKISGAEPPWKCPDCFQMTVIEMEKFQMELLTAKESPNTEKIILQLHGGGYVGAMRNAYRMFAGLYSEVSHGMSVLTVDYRVAPEHPYPAALEDAYAAYCYLLDEGWFSEQIILAGDSAGGGLAMALCHYLKDKGKQLPAGIVAMSPWTDLTASGESYDTNYEKDPLFGKTRDSLIYNKDYIGDNDPLNAYISPLFGDFRGFPPMLIQVGSYEMLLSDSVSVAAKARQQGVKVRLSIYDGMFHIFQMAAKMLPESKRAWVEIGKFIDVLLND